MQITVKGTALLGGFVNTLPIEWFQSCLLFIWNWLIVTIVKEKPIDWLWRIIYNHIVVFLLCAGHGPRPKLSIIFFEIWGIVKIGFALTTSEYVQ